MHKFEDRDISRRDFTSAGFAASVALINRSPMYARDSGIVSTMISEAAKAKISVRALRRHISVLEGSGGNIAVLTGPDGKLLVDAGFAVSRPAIGEALTSINSDPIKHLINTHWHTDHTDGNEWLHSEGASITAHDNTRKRMSVATKVEDWNHTFPAAPLGALPATVFTSECDLHRNDSFIQMKHYAPAHTDSDISVCFTEADITHVGDTWWNGLYPFIDYSTGGSIDGSIRAAEVNLAATTNKTIIIPGHGPVGGKSDVREFRDMLVTVRENTAALKKEGRSVDETIAARPTAAFDEKWGQFLITPTLFTRLVYAGV